MTYKALPRDPAGNPATSTPPPPKRGGCVHCGRVGPLKPRLLCRRCYYNPAVRGEHPVVLAASGPARRGAIRGTAVGPGGRPLPEPTDALPGSAEKIEVMRLRAAAGQLLYHPLDGRKVASQVASGRA